jgi:uncharacterized small protein (DUF1192 family)
MDPKLLQVILDKTRGYLQGALNSTAELDAKLTVANDEIARLQQELATQVKRATEAEAKLSQLNCDGGPGITQLQ